MNSFSAEAWLSHMDQIREKDKIINRLHIYSRGRKLPTIKHKEFSSTPTNLDKLGVSPEAKWNTAVIGPSFCSC